jgi:hypothetical protein
MQIQIESLQRISLPFLKNGKYRAFPVTGDSTTQREVLCSWRIFERTSDIVDGKHISLSQKIVECHKRLYKRRI